MSSIVYIGEINGVESYLGTTNLVSFTFSNGQWRLDITDRPLIHDPSIAQLDTIRHNLITRQSTTKCASAAETLMKKICSVGPFSDFTQDVIHIIESYLASCYPWQSHPDNPLPAKVTLLTQGILDVTNMTQMSTDDKTYYGITSRGWVIIATRAVDGNHVDWYSSEIVRLNTMQKVVLETRRKEILGQI